MEFLLWAGFIVLVLILLALDLGVHRRHPHILPLSEALAWTGLYIVLAVAFSAAVYFMYELNWMGVGGEFVEDLSGGEAAVSFFTAWLLEKSLSLDNIFVIAVVFSYFQVPALEQHRVLFWGILGALVLRGIMIWAGVALLHRFEWVVYVFGALLLITAVRMLTARHDSIEPGKNPLVRFCKRRFPVTDGFRGSAFFVRVGRRLHATPLFLALLVVESTDLLFALDSIPAAFAVTRDPFLIFTSNIFAVLGLRALYFALAGLMHRFRYLKMSLVFILAYVGVKFMLIHHYPMPTIVSLFVILGFIGVGIVASVFREDTAPIQSPLQEDMESLAALTMQQARRVVVLILGSSVMLVGLVILLAPGRGLLIVGGGLAFLGLEFAWARIWLQRTKKTVLNIQREFRDELDRLGGSPPG